MLNEIYVDNFRTLVNFNLSLERFQLWLGDNGTGKTSVIETIARIQKVVQGNAVNDVFSCEDLTSWTKKTTQEFSLTFGGEEDVFEYALSIEHDKKEGTSRILSEELKWNHHVFFRYKEREVHLYRIHRTSGDVEEGTSFPTAPNRSFLSVMEERPDNYPINRFKNELMNCLIVSPNPIVVSDNADKESKRLMLHAENFALWYRHLLQEDPGIGYTAGEYLKEVIPGYEMLSLNESGNSRRLRANFGIQNKDLSFDFGRLSDGQKQLIILYTLLASFKKDICSILVLDEPDNFVTLREIEPWWNDLNDICRGSSKQSVIISHHPTIVNRMGESDAIWFSRPHGGHTVVKRYAVVDGLTPAETLERGWAE